MNTEELQTTDVRVQMIKALRERASLARRNANIALFAVFILIFSGISLFYFAGDIVKQQSEWLPVTAGLPPGTNVQELERLMEGK